MVLCELFVRDGEAGVLVYPGRDLLNFFLFVWLFDVPLGAMIEFSLIVVVA